MYILLAYQWFLASTLSDNMLKVSRRTFGDPPEG